MLSYYERYWKDKKTNSMVDFTWKWPSIKKYIPTEKLNILDFGCGTGEIIKESLKINKKSNFTGIDVSNDAIRRAKKRLSKSSFYQVNDGAKFPIQNNTFDFITALDVIEHVYDIEKTLKELNRVLKNSGKILISTPYNGAIKIILFTLLGQFDKYFNPTGPHIRFFNPKSLSETLNDHGFRTLNHGYYGRFYPLSKGFFILAKKFK